MGFGERFALGLIAFAVLLRVAVPAGWMPSDQGRWITLCAVEGMRTAYVDARGQLHHNDPGEVHKAKQHCAFAGLGAPLDHPPVAAAPPAFAVAPATDAVRVLPVAIGRGLAAPPPPSTGPPAFA